MISKHTSLFVLGGAFAAAVGCSSAPTPAPSPERVATSAAADTKGGLPQSPDDALKDYLYAKDHPPAPLATRDGDGHPILYYGRVFVRASVERRVLDVFGFKHDPSPFFDDFNGVVGHSQAEGHENGYWEYAIATGAQFNFLIKNPGIVSAIEMSPRLNPSAPHPMLDSVMRSGGGLDAATLAKQGFTLELPKLLQLVLAPCTQDGIKAQGIWDDITSGLGDAWDWVKGAASDVADWVANKLKDAGSTLSEVLVDMAKAGRDVVDWLRELGNAGVCAIAGHRSSTGSVQVIDPLTNKPVIAGFGQNINQPEPLRGGTIRARGGWGGVLLTQADIGADGTYTLDSLCGDLTYTLAYEVNTPAIWMTYNGILDDSFDLGSVGPNTPATPPWMATTPSAHYAIGAQLQQQLVAELWGIRTGQAKVFAGDVADKVSAANHQSFTACGEGALLAAFIPLSAPLLDGDIYFTSSSENLQSGNDQRNPIGVAIHEYGHFSMCEAIRQNGGDLDSYLNSYLLTMITSATKPPNELLMGDVRNTAESIADYLTFHASGYTNYFSNDSNNAICGDAAGDASRPCLESDSASQLPTTADGNAWVKSRAAVMYDWTDDGVRDYGFELVSPFRHDTDDEKLAMRRDAVARAVAGVGAQITTQNIASLLAQSAVDNRPAEDICRVFTNHGWSCTNLQVDGATLDAPLEFSGTPISNQQIVWRWAPTSVLATSYELVNADGAGYHDVQSMSVNDVEVTQTLPVAKGNQRVVAAIEARRDGTQPGRSARAEVCTLADPVNALTANVQGTSIKLGWPADSATDYEVQRAEAGGDFATIATVRLTMTGSSYVDAGVAPAVAYRYRVLARNCTGQETPGNAVNASVSLNDADFVFVRAGSTGGDGTRAKPFGALVDAVAIATTARNRILVAEGTYTDQVDARSGISLSFFGGYDATFATRDPKTHASTVVGNSSATEQQVGGGYELPTQSAALFINNAAVTLDGLTVRPVARSCAGTADCRPSTLVAAADVTLVNVDYVGTDLGGSGYPTSQPYGDVICAPTCTIVDSRLDAGNVKGAVLVHAPASASTTVSITGSTLVAGVAGTAVDAREVLMQTSTVRGSSTGWTTAGSTAVIAWHAEITHSILTGATPLQQTGPGITSGFDSESSVSYLVNSLVYGNALVTKLDILDNVFINGAQSLSFGSSPTTGNILRHNMFVFLGGNNGNVARGTSNRAVSDAQVNDPNAWFGSPQNLVTGNVTANALAPLFGADTDATPVVARFHPLASSALIGAGVASTRPLPDHDMDGAAVPTNVFNIGPYVNGR